jgi:hypothetical protein
MWQSVQKNSTDVAGIVEEAYLSRHREANEEESRTPGFHVCESQAKGKVQLVPYGGRLQKPDEVGPFNIPDDPVFLVLFGKIQR